MRLLALIALMNSTACRVQTPTQTVADAGRHEETISIDGTDRTYVLVVPRDYSSDKPAPMLVLLHGKTSNANQILNYSRLGKLGPLEGYIVVAPNGMGDISGWNCGFMNMGPKGVDDIKFIGALMSKVQGQFSVDPKRIFVAGHSNGGILSYAIASAYSDKVAAIGVVEGSAGLDRPRIKRTVSPPRSPVSAIIFHGKKDPLVPYQHNGGLADMFLPPVESAALWAHDVGATGDAKTTALNDGGSVMTWLAPKAEVRLVTVDEGTHMWPGGITALKSGASPVDATMMMLEFFKSHPKS
jgi:polyhydroxybutyrate depolymerase